MFKSFLSEKIFLRTAVITGTVGLFIVSFLMDRSVFASSGNETNKAARIKIFSSSFEKELAGKKAPAGKIFILLETEWENIHPKQKVEKAKLEGKVDRTMGGGRPRRPRHPFCFIHQIPLFYLRELRCGLSWPLIPTMPLPGYAFEVLRVRAS